MQRPPHNSEVRVYVGSAGRESYHHSNRDTLKQSYLALAALTFAGAAGAQAPTATHASLAASPASPAPGAIVRLTVRAPATDAVDTVTGTLAGEPLHFVRVSDTVWHAIGGVPVDAARSVTAHAQVRLKSGGEEPLTAVIGVPPIPKRRTEAP